MYLFILLKWTLESLTTFPAGEGGGCWSCYLVGDALVALELVSCPVSQVLPVPLLWDLTYRPQHFSINPQNLLSLQELRIKHLLRFNRRENVPLAVRTLLEINGNKYILNIKYRRINQKGNINSVLRMKVTQISNQDEAPVPIYRWVICCSAGKHLTWQENKPSGCLPASVCLPASNELKLWFYL